VELIIARRCAESPRTAGQPPPAYREMVVKVFDELGPR
jgi:hypothetical protein